MGRVVWAVGDGGPNRRESMRVRDEEFMKRQWSSWHTVGPQEMVAVMICLWKVLRNLKWNLPEPSPEFSLSQGIKKTNSQATERNCREKVSCIGERQEGRII